jgi:cation diffusion facilitator family transporter
MNIRIQRNLAFLSLGLFIFKIYAWYVTHSVTILTDALEYTVNVIMGFLGIYSLILSAKPRDENHPYGHGKVQFVTSAIEGALIFISGLFIIYEAVAQYVEAKPLQKLDVGIWLLLGTGIVNYVFGRYAATKGKQNRSIVLQSAGQHLMSDAYATAAISGGVLVIMFTHWLWMDSLVALVFALVTIITGYKVMRKSMAGIMDEADEELILEVVSFMQQHRKEHWIDLHNLRVIQYGEVLHIDAHITFPWYYTVAQSDEQIHALEDYVTEHFGNKVEFFIHVDGCMTYQCKLCALQNCPHRKNEFEALITWNLQNVRKDAKHGL